MDYLLSFLIIVIIGVLIGVLIWVMFKPEEKNETKLSNLEIEIRDLLQEIESLEDKEDFNGIIKICTKGIELILKNNNYEILIKDSELFKSLFFKRAFFYKKLKKYELSIADFEFLVILSEEKNDEYLFGLSEALFLKGEFKLANEYLSKAILIDKNNPGYYLLRAGTFASEFKFNEILNYDAALADITYCLKLEPDNPVALDLRLYILNKQNNNVDESMFEINLKAINLMDEGNFQMASENFSKVIELIPSKDILVLHVKSEDSALEDGILLTDVYNNRAGCYMHLNDYELALKDYIRIKELSNNGDYRAFSGIGGVNVKKEQFEEGLENFTKAISLNSEDYNSFFNRAMCNATLGKISEALMDVNKYLEYFPDDTSALVLKKVLVEGEEFKTKSQTDSENKSMIERGEKYLIKNAKLIETQNIELIVAQRMDFNFPNKEKQKNYDIILDSLRKNSIARFFLKEGNLDLAMKSIEVSINEFQNPYNILTLAEIKIEKELFQEAIELLNKALNLPTSPRIDALIKFCRAKSYIKIKNIFLAYLDLMELEDFIKNYKKDPFDSIMNNMIKSTGMKDFTINLNKSVEILEIKKEVPLLIQKYKKEFDEEYEKMVFLNNEIEFTNLEKELLISWKFKISREIRKILIDKKISSKKKKIEIFSKILNSLAWTHFENHRNMEALNRVLKSIDYFENEYNLDTLAMIYLENNKLDEALLASNKSIKLNKIISEHFYNRAKILIKIGKINEAIKDLEKSIELDQGFKTKAEELLSTIK